MVEHITQYRIFPTDIDGCKIDSPNYDILSVGRNSQAKINVQGLDLASECVTGDVVDDPWYKRALIIAV